MQYDVETPAEYLEAVEEGWRKERLEFIRGRIFAKFPEVEESIGYKMLRYSLGGETLCHLNAQRAHVGFYVCSTQGIDPEGSLLKGFDCGKGCIRIKKKHPLEAAWVDQVLENLHRYRQANPSDSCAAN